MRSIFNLFKEKEVAEPIRIFSAPNRNNGDFYAIEAPVNQGNLQILNNLRKRTNNALKIREENGTYKACMKAPANSSGYISPNQLTSLFADKTVALTSGDFAMAYINNNYLRRK